MKRIFTLFFAGISICANAQRLFTEDFNYNAGYLTQVGGDNVSNGTWTNFSGSGNYLQVVPGNLFFPNYYTSPTATSNKLRLVDFPTSSEDAYASFATQATGTVYSSFVVRLLKSDNLNVNTSTAGEYFLAFLPSNSLMAFTARVFVRQGSLPNTVNFGINTTSTSSSNPPVYDPIDYPIAIDHLITMAYQFVDGPSNDVARIWVNKPFSIAEPVPSATAFFPTGVAEQADLGRLAIRQGTFFTPNADIDAITVATTYAASLPLNLTSFTGSLLNKAAFLNWSSTNENNVKGFAVEKGLNGADFTEIAFVAAKNTPVQNDYSFEDVNVKGGTNYYRLKMVDVDGSSRYSAVVLVNNNASLSAQVFPNPAKSNLNITHQKAVRGASLRVVSLDGKVLKAITVQTGATQTGISISELRGGNYVVVFDNNGAKAVTQFTKQ